MNQLTSFRSTTLNAIASVKLADRPIEVGFVSDRQGSHQFPEGDRGSGIDSQPTLHARDGLLHLPPERLSLFFSVRLGPKSPFIGLNNAAAQLPEADTRFQRAKPDYSDSTEHLTLNDVLLKQQTITLRGDVK